MDPFKGTPKSLGSLLSPKSPKHGSVSGLQSFGAQLPSPATYAVRVQGLGFSV